MQIYLIAVSGSAHKDRLEQCHVRRPLLVYGRFPIVLASRLMWAHSVATLDTMLMNNLFPLPQLPIFVLGK